MVVRSLRLMYVIIYKNKERKKKAFWEAWMNGEEILYILGRAPRIIPPSQSFPTSHLWGPPTKD